MLLSSTSDDAASTTMTTVTTNHTNTAATTNGSSNNSSSNSNMTQSERLQQARSHRRSLGHSHHKHRTEVVIHGSTSNSTSNSSTVSSTMTTTTPPAVAETMIASSQSSMESSNSSNSSHRTGSSTKRMTNHPNPTTTATIAIAAPRYRTLPGLVASPPPSSTSTTITTSSSSQNNSTTPAASKSVSSSSIGRYRPSKSPVTTSTAVPQKTSSSTSTTTMTSPVPARTWRNIHEMVPTMKVSDTPSTSSNNNNNAEDVPNVQSPTPAVTGRNTNNNNTTTTTTTTNQNSQPWKYRNLHHTLLSPSHPDSTHHVTPTTHIPETPIPSKTTSATPASPEPVMNRWKYKYNMTHHTTTTTTTSNIGTENKTTTVKKSSPVLLEQTTVTTTNTNTAPLPPPPTSSNNNSKVTVAAPHSYTPPAPSQQQYGFVSSPTNHNGSNCNTNPPPTSWNNNTKKQSYHLAHNNHNSNGAIDETSTLSLGTSHSFASSQSSSSPLPMPSVGNHFHPTVPTVTHSVKSTVSPTSLTLSHSRSFGSQPSMTSKKSPSAVSTTLSNVPSWKSNVTPQKPDATAIMTSTNVVYGAPVPAWKKKLLEQQRLQQQEKAASVIPKWKRKPPVEPKPPSAVTNHSTTSIVVDHDMMVVTTSPSDEQQQQLDHTAVVDQVIVPTLSNVVTVDSVQDRRVMVGGSSLPPPSTTTTSTSKWSTTKYSNASIKSPEVMTRPQLRWGASPETGTVGTRAAGGVRIVNPSTSESMAPSKSSWINKTHSHTSGGGSGSAAHVIVGAASEDTVSIPSPEKDDPAEQSGIGESTSLLSPRRRGDMTIHTVESSVVHNDATVGRSTKQWESPRTARLEAMKANATPNSAFSRPGPMGKASPVVLPNHVMSSPETTKKWQPPPKKETPKSAFGAIVTDDAPESYEPIVKQISTTAESLVETSEESTMKSSVAEMKARLWGTGRTEKLVVVPAPKDIPIVRNVEESELYSTQQPALHDDHLKSFGSPTRNNSNGMERVISMTPPKPTTTSKSVGPSSQPILPSFTRGRPDVCTPNGPLPPQRSSGRSSDKQLPPRRNLDTLWMNRLEQTNMENNSAATLDVISGETSINPPNDVNVNRNGVGLSVHDTNIIYSDSTIDYVEELQNDEVLPPPPPPAERNSHHRSPSLGDFQITANQSVKETVEDVSSEFVISSPPVSPRVSRPSDPISPTIRPAIMTKWDDIPSPSKSGSSSPTSRRLLPPKLPPTSPAAAEKKEMKGRFAEMIDCPPLDDPEKWGTDADMTGPKELMDAAPHPLSPRSKHDRPWTKDANTLAPNTWMKPKADPHMETDISTPTRPPRADPPSSVERMGDEKKSSEDVLYQAQSPSSLMRMAADSIHAVDYDKAVQGMQRQSILDEDDESLLSAATPGSTIPAVLPPEFEKAMSDTEGYDARAAHIPVFGDPTSFGAAGGEVVAEVPVRVADRAKALASWNGGLGVSPTRPLQPDHEIAPTLSPIRRLESESEVEGMSPRISKRGFGLDDWKRTKSFDSKSEFETSSDFWQPSNLDNQSQVDEKDWSRCDPDVDGSNLSRSDSLNKDIVSSPAPTPVLISTHESKKSTPPLLEKSKMDTDSRPKMTWKKKPLVPKPDGTSVPPRPIPKAGSVKARKSDIGSEPMPLLSGRSNKTQATPNHENANSSDPFDPFEFSFSNGHDKVEFTEVTEFSDGTDFFSVPDPFNMDPASFPILQEQRPLTSTNPTQSTHLAPPSHDDDNEDGDADAEYEDEYMYDGEYPPTLSGLNPPSGSNLSQYEVWSYDADTSNLQDGAAEI